MPPLSNKNKAKQDKQTTICKVNPAGFRLDNSNIEYDISNIDESAFRDAIFYKERWINENGL